MPAAKYTPKKKELTDRQRQILDFIEAETTERGYPPSVREIGEAVVGGAEYVHGNPAVRVGGASSRVVTVTLCRASRASPGASRPDGDGC